MNKTMINKAVKYICCEPLDHIENYYRASTDHTQMWHCHHKLEISLQLSKKELIERNLYYNRPANELIFMRPQEHHKLHKSQASFHVVIKEALNRPETKAKLSAALKEAMNRPDVKAKNSAAQKEAQNRPEVKARRNAAIKEAYSRPEVKAKRSAAMKDRKWINNGVINKYVKPSELDNYLANGWMLGWQKYKINI